MDDPYEDRVMPVDQTIPSLPMESGLMNDLGSFQPPENDFYSILNVPRTVRQLWLMDLFFNEHNPEPRVDDSMDSCRMGI